MRGTQSDSPDVFKSKACTSCFYCRARRREVEKTACIDDFVTANAFEHKRSACFRCHQGRKVREEFAGTN